MSPARTAVPADGRGLDHGGEGGIKDRSGQKNRPGIGAATAGGGVVPDSFTTRATSRAPPLNDGQSHGPVTSRSRSVQRVARASFPTADDPHRPPGGRASPAEGTSRPTRPGPHTRRTRAPSLTPREAARDLRMAAADLQGVRESLSRTRQEVLTPSSRRSSLGSFSLVSGLSTDQPRSVQWTCRPVSEGARSPGREKWLLFRAGLWKRSQLYRRRIARPVVSTVASAQRRL